MSKEMEEQLLFSIFLSENEQIYGRQKLHFITESMRKKYGGLWSIHKFNPNGSRRLLRYNYGFFAEFDYEHLRWNVYQQGC